MDGGLYHAVPGHTNGQQAFRAAGGFEGTGYLKKPLFSVIFGFSAVACGGWSMVEVGGGCRDKAM
jgi:hypothetical protein